MILFDRCHLGAFRFALNAQRLELPLPARLDHLLIILGRADLFARVIKKVEFDFHAEALAVAGVYQRAHGIREGTALRVFQSDGPSLKACFRGWVLRFRRRKRLMGKGYSDFVAAAGDKSVASFRLVSPCFRAAATNAAKIADADDSPAMSSGCHCTPT